MLIEHGHIVIFHRDALPEGAKDEVVCATALENDAILVALDSDMKQMARRYGAKTKVGRFATLNVIMLHCNEVLASKRLEQAITLIENEWSFAEGKTARRLWIEVASHFIRTYR